MTPEEFKHIAPKLYSLRHSKTGFITPKSYFDALEGNVFDKITKEQEASFAVPKDYFDSIEDRVFEKIHTPKVIHLKAQFIKTFLPVAVAASLVLFFTLNLFNKSDKQDLFATIETSEIENWIENGNLEIDTYEITAIYDEADFDEIDLDEQYNEDDLTGYLETIDLESLLLTN